MQDLIDSKDDAFSLDDEGQILWQPHQGQKSPIAVLTTGKEALQPALKLLPEYDDTETTQVTQRLELWLQNEMQTRLAPLLELQKQVKSGTLEPEVQGLAKRLVEQLGSLDRRAIAGELRALNQEQRGSLRLFGVRFGEFSLFMPVLLRPAPCRLLALLLAFGPLGNKKPYFAPPGLTSIKSDGDIDNASLSAVGLRKCGNRLIRLDMLERVGAEIRSAREAAKTNEFQPTLEMVALLGCSKPELAEVLSSLGYRKIKTILDKDGAVDELSCSWNSKTRTKNNKSLHKPTAEQKNLNKKPKARNKKSKEAEEKKKIDPDNPFAVLQGLKLKT